MMGQASELAINVSGLVKRFGTRTVVDQVALQVPQGAIYGFLGPNGSGKTTTIRLLCGLLTPDAGTGTCLGLDFRTHAESIKRQTGYMTQKFSFWEDLTIKENLAFVARMYGLDRPQARVDQALERLGLTGRAGQLAGALSGGWKQRLALAASILHEPKLLLLDEPTAGVDPKARRAFWDEIHALAAEGLTVLVSTHYMDEAERCHAIVYMAYGKVMARGTVDDVIGASGLHTFEIDGPATADLAARLRSAPGVETVAPFGTRLHISGMDELALSTALDTARADPALRVTKSQPTLEDVFIHLMGHAQDNFQ